MSTTNQKENFKGTDNVWVKRLGLILLLLGMGVFNFIPYSEVFLIPLIIIVITFAVIAYLIKQIRGFLKSFWY